MARLPSLPPSSSSVQKTLGGEVVELEPQLGGQRVAHGELHLALVGEDLPVGIPELVLDREDLPDQTQSGLDVAVDVLKKIDDIAFCYLTSQDVVRHPLVQKIVKAYDDFEAKEKHRSRERSRR